MPVRDRKFYIAKHNGIVESEKTQKDGSVINGEMINTYASLFQENEKNSKNR